jgi:hypothetical protein
MVNGTIIYDTDLVFIRNIDGDRLELKRILFEKTREKFDELSCISTNKLFGDVHDFLRIMASFHGRFYQHCNGNKKLVL